jgi:predicted ATP-dependent Lon-type protease
VPGWEIPKISRATLTQGLVVDYFGEYLLRLRNLEMRGEARRLAWGQHLMESGRAESRR